MGELFNEFNAGGIFMYVILAISIFATCVIIYKAYYLWIKIRMPIEEFSRTVMQQVEGNNFSRAIELCKTKIHPLSQIFHEVLLRANKPEKEIRRAVEVSASVELPKLRKLTHVLPHFSNISTMVGLLGTIRGLIIAFSGMEIGDSVKRQEALSTGIALAFRATFFALSVAAIMVFFFVILNSKQTSIINRMEHATTSLVDLLVAGNNKRLLNRKEAVER